MLRRKLKNPPMGWNSWDCFGASVTEKELLENATYMKEHLKKYGWEYVVCDIQWSEPDADSTEYHNFVPLTMDEYGRLLPSPKRFPSAANGVGFKAIADKIHAMGLKFGIHIMRGIPRQAVHANVKIKGTSVTARQIAQKYSICKWNTDMYGVDPLAYGAQSYYDSLFELYSEWGVDFVKVDDICNTYFKPDDLYSAKEEIELISRAINRCKRDMVLSLSPGPADVSQVRHLQKYADMWRITADFWDSWDDLSKMFERCNMWSEYVGDGSWPDCDMLPLGYINLRGSERGNTGARMTRFTREEQITLMTLWCIFRSPLMFGGNLPDNDEDTLNLLTNQEVLSLLTKSHGAKQVTRCGSAKESIVWKSFGEDGEIYVAFFNLHVQQRHLQISLDWLELPDGTYDVYDLWDHKEVTKVTDSIDCVVGIHGAKLYRLKKVE